MLQLLQLNLLPHCCCGPLLRAVCLSACLFIVQRVRIRTGVLHRKGVRVGGGTKCAADKAPMERDLVTSCGACLLAVFAASAQKHSWTQFVCG